MAKKKPTFEEALRQLEAIAEQIEAGRIGLEESITKYEEGMGLVRRCREILAKAEHKIQKLQQRDDGTLEATGLNRRESERTRPVTSDAERPEQDKPPINNEGSAELGF